MARDLPRGIRRTPDGGYQAYVWVHDPTKPKRGYQASKRFPATTKIGTMTRWRGDRKHGRLDAPTPAPPTFAEDVAVYLALESIQRMPTSGQRTQHLQEWAAVFRGRPRAGIAALDIEIVRDQWWAKMSASSVNKRLRALSNLWTKLDGRRAPNPVRDVDECEEPDPEARGLPYDVIEAILAAIPDVACGQRKDGTRTLGKGVPRPSKAKARLRVIAYTGLSHSQLKALTRADVDLETGTVRLIARRKGRKLRRAADRRQPVTMPLIPQAVDAFTIFDVMDCWGPFSNSTMWRGFAKACKQLGLTGLTPYDFRHSFLSAVYAETKDLRVTGLFGGQRSAATTARYTLTAVPPHVQAAADRVAAILPRQKMDPRNESESTPASLGQTPKAEDRPEKRVGASGFEPLTPAV